MDEFGQIFNRSLVLGGQHFAELILAIGAGGYQQVGPGILKLLDPPPGRVLFYFNCSCSYSIFFLCEKMVVT